VLTIYPGRLVLLTVLLTTLAPSASFGRDKHATSPCDKPREIATQPKFSKEQSARARDMRVQGQIDISVNEDGDVIDAKVVRLYPREKGNSREAVDLLLIFAKSAKFKPRTGCGVTHTTINFTLLVGN
jgi:hypothetical protein